MGTHALVNLLSDKHRTAFEAIKNHAEMLLDHTHRFKYFTLHGKQHIDNVLKNVEFLGDAGLILKPEQAFLLGCAICIHDLGMVVPLQDLEASEIFRGRPQPSDLANLELEIRKTHHELVDSYIKEHFIFLSDLGIPAGDCAILRDIARCHRKIDLNSVMGFSQSLGALLRLVDELDISPTRAPAPVLLGNFEEMDATSCWHWFKHNICEDWRLQHNAIIQQGEFRKLTFKLAVHPPKASSIPYWLTQISRPLARVLYDEGTSRIIIENWGLQVSLEKSQEMSSAVSLPDPWDQIESKALSEGRKVILVIDDEVRKLEDLFLALEQDYRVVYSPNAKDALDKLAANPADLAIVDLQIGSGSLWSPDETGDFKMTGINLCEHIKEYYPDTKIGILTGSRHDLTEVKAIEGLSFLLKKPIYPDDFEGEVRRVLA